MNKPQPPAQNTIKDASVGLQPLWQCWIPAEPGAVLATRRQIMHLCRTAGVAEAECAELDLALGEALANAVTHGVAGAAKAAAVRIEVSAWDYRGHLIIQINDHGPGFIPPPPPYEMPKAGQLDVHGRGLPLMERLTDALLVSQGDVSEGGVSIYLIKDLSPKSETVCSDGALWRRWSA